ncbi:MAG TPA: hypothetical protein VFP08_02405 [Acidimicrobiales bacterium]|nr:hypothetical protein [Acidimicrobiales bacterium]
MKVTITVDDAGTDDAQMRLSTTDTRSSATGPEISAGAAPTGAAADATVGVGPAGDPSGALPPTSGSPISAGPAPSDE